MSQKPDSSDSQTPKAFSLKTGKRPQPVKQYSPGDVLFSEGEAGRELFYIEEGEVIVSIGEKEDRVELARVGAGSYIGEMSLFDNLPRSATVTSTQNTKASITTESTFEELFRYLPLWLSSVVKIIIARLRDTNQKLVNRYCRTLP